MLPRCQVPLRTTGSKFRAPKKSLFKYKELLSLMSNMNPDPVAHAIVDIFGNIKQFKSMICNSDKDSRFYITNLSSERLGRMRFTATGVPRQQTFKISPKDPCQN